MGEPQTHTSVILDVRVGGLVRVGGEQLQIQVLQKSGKVCRLRITAPEHITIKKVDDVLASMPDCVLAEKR